MRRARRRTRRRALGRTRRTASPEPPSNPADNVRHQEPTEAQPCVGSTPCVPVADLEHLEKQPRGKQSRADPPAALEDLHHRTRERLARERSELRRHRGLRRRGLRRRGLRRDRRGPRRSGNPLGLVDEAVDAHPLKVAPPHDVLGLSTSLRAPIQSGVRQVTVGRSPSGVGARSPRDLPDEHLPLAPHQRSRRVGRRTRGPLPALTLFVDARGFLEGSEHGVRSRLGRRTTPLTVVVALTLGGRRASLLARVVGGTLAIAANTTAATIERPTGRPPGR